MYIIGGCLKSFWTFFENHFPFLRDKHVNISVSWVIEFLPWWVKISISKEIIVFCEETRHKKCKNLSFKNALNLCENIFHASDLKTFSITWMFGTALSSNIRLKFCYPIIRFIQNKKVHNRTDANKRSTWKKTVSIREHPLMSSDRVGRGV